MWLIHITVIGCHLVVNPVWFKATLLDRTVNFALFFENS